MNRLDHVSVQTDKINRLLHRLPVWVQQVLGLVVTWLPVDSKRTMPDPLKFTALILVWPCWTPIGDSCQNSFKSYTILSNIAGNRQQQLGRTSSKSRLCISSLSNTSLINHPLRAHFPQLMRTAWSSGSWSAEVGFPPLPTNTLISGKEIHHSVIYIFTESTGLDPFSWIDL